MVARGGVECAIDALSASYCGRGAVADVDDERLARPFGYISGLRAGTGSWRAGESSRGKGLVFLDLEVIVVENRPTHGGQPVAFLESNGGTGRNP